MTHPRHQDQDGKVRIEPQTHSLKYLFVPPSTKAAGPNLCTAYDQRRDSVDLRSSGKLS